MIATTGPLWHAETMIVNQNRVGMRLLWAIGVGLLADNEVSLCAMQAEGLQPHRLTNEFAG